jgi:acyl-coenzyme A synthetase/AMP-(fatty) acid ligase
VFHSPPNVFRQLAETMLEGEKYPHLRLIRLSRASVSRLEFDLYKQKFAPGSLLQIVMNSTEANVICSFVTDGKFRFPKNGCPVGYPVPGKNIVLLDESGDEVAGGGAGRSQLKAATSLRLLEMADITKAKYLPDSHGSGDMFI